MKMRQGFVSNSSSSSFICAVCGSVRTGYDISYSDEEMLCCENGHEFCEDHIVDEDGEIEDIWDWLDKIATETYPKFDDESDDEYEDRLSDARSDVRSEIPEKYCPICSMKIIPNKYLVEFMFKHFNITREQVNELIRKQVTSFSELKNLVKDVE